MVPGTVQVTKIRVRDARAQLGLTQKALAEKADVGRQVVYYAEHPEHKINIDPVSAWAILNTLNRIRKEQGLGELEYGNMDWKVRGDGNTEEK